jgi:segregation and condensation protein B
MSEDKKIQENTCPKNHHSQIEAILFAVGEPVGIGKLAKATKLSKKECQQEVKKLEKFYQENNSGLALIHKKDKIQLASGKEHAEIISNFLNKQLSEKLSRAALEILAVIAYRGPISRSEIEFVRGVNCSYTLRNLAMRGLIEKKENPENTRSFLYEVSFDFMKHLGITKIEELPDYKTLKEKSFSDLIEEDKKEEKAT